MIEDGYIYGRAAAVSKCDFSTYIFAVRALEALGAHITVRRHTDGFAKGASKVKPAKTRHHRKLCNRKRVLMIVANIVENAIEPGAIKCATGLFHRTTSKTQGYLQD